MKRPDRKALLAVTSALTATSNLFNDGFYEIVTLAGREAVLAHSQIEDMQINQKGGTFFRYFLPLRKRMVTLLAETYRRCFKLALAHASLIGDDPHVWAWSQLQPAVAAALEWMRDWYILACDGENQNVRRVGTLDFVPGQTVSVAIPLTVSPFPPSESWRAPAWLFGISLPLYGIGIVKQRHAPNTDSTERLGAAHTRLLLKGARRVFLWELAGAIGTIRNEETAAAGAMRIDYPVYEQKRDPNKRKGWQQRLKLYGAIQKVLSAKPGLEGIEFCAELDKRHAPPLLDWIEGGDWRKGLTWKEAWGDADLRRKIRRVRQEAQKAS